MDHRIHRLDSTALLKKLRAGEIKSLDLTNHFIARIEKHDDRLNAVVVRNFDHARARAVEADKAFSEGKLLGRLHGLPMTVKEDKDVAGTVKTLGDPALAGNITPKDEVLIKRLTSEGAIIIGKTNIPYHMSDIQSFNDVYGSTNNPYDVSRTPGGSSGGSAAALAAMFTPLEIGGDIGGSIRLPAHFCGLYGHKPTWALVPKRNTSIACQIDLSVNGPLARSPEDLQLVMEVISGPDKHDLPMSYRNSPKSYQFDSAPTLSLKDLRIAFWADDEISPVGDDILKAVSIVRDFLQESGVSKMSTSARPDFSSKEIFDVYRNLLGAALANGRTDAEEEAIRVTAANLAADDTSDTAFAFRAMAISKSAWDKVHKQRLVLLDKWRKFFQEYDFVLAPIAVAAAIPHDPTPHEQPFWRPSPRVVKIKKDGQDLTVPYHRQVFWSCLATAPLLPATQFPVYCTDEGLPVGLQVIGPDLSDARTIAFTRLLRDASNGRIGQFVPPKGFD